MAKLMIFDGRIIDTFKMKKENVSAEAIILGASRINRFLGQTKYAYPVAAHLIGGYWYLDSELTKKQWLIHEAFGVSPAESDEVKALDRAIMVAESLILMPNKDYWNQFAKDNNITPIGSEYVLSEVFCSEKTLYETLSEIWGNVFGLIDTKKDKSIPVEEFKKLLDSSDAIVVGDSPILTDWNLDDDETDLIYTKWTEDDLEYICCINIEDIQYIEKNKNNYTLFLPNSKEKISLMKLSYI